MFFTSADDVVLDPIRRLGAPIPYLAPATYDAYEEFDAHALYTLLYGFGEVEKGREHKPRPPGNDCPQGDFFPPVEPVA
jgi:hypothetical protein